MKRNKILVLLVVGSLILVLAAGLFRGARARRSAVTAAADLKGVVERGNLDVVITGTGTVQAGEHKELRAAMSGSVARFDADEGMFVETGQVLAELDVQDIRSQIDAKKIDLEIQERELQKLKEEQTQDSLKAPAAGEVVWSVRNGDRIQAGAAIASVTDYNYLEVRGRFNGTQITAIKEGQAAAFYLPDHALEFGGHVISISSVPRAGRSEPGTAAAYEVKAEFTNLQNLPDGAAGRMAVATAGGSKQAIERTALRVTEPANLRAPIGGTFTQRVKSGSKVTAGQWLGELSDSQRRAQLDSQIAGAEVRLQQSYIDQRELERQLAQTGWNDENLFSRIHKLQLDIAGQEAELSRLRDEVTYEGIFTPAEGELHWLVKDGERVQAGQIVATLRRVASLESTGRFTAEQVRDIAVGQHVDFYLADYGITVRGKVVEVGSVAKGTNLPAGPEALYEVAVALKNPGSLEANLAGHLTVATASGEIRTVQAVTATTEPYLVRAAIAGTVAIHVESGRAVKRDQVLGEITDPDRTSQLGHQIATTELRLQQSRLDLAEKNRQQRENAQKAVIRSPMNGTILLPPQIPAVGDEIAPGTLIATVADYSKMQVVVAVDELDVTRIVPGMPVRVTVAALPDATFAGKVHAIAQEGKAQGGVSVFDVTVVLESGGGLRAGMTANVEILVESLQDVLLVPLEFITSSDGKSKVLTTDGTTGPPKLVEVVTGASDTSRIQILAGLREGQQIMLPGSGAAAAQGERPGGFPPGGGFPRGGGVSQ